MIFELIGFTLVFILILISIAGGFIYTFWGFNGSGLKKDIMGGLVILSIGFYAMYLFWPLGPITIIFK